MKEEQVCPASSSLFAKPMQMGHQIDNVIDPSIDPCWPLRPIRLMVASGLSFTSLVSFHLLCLFVCPHTHKQTQTVTQTYLTPWVSNPSQFYCLYCRTLFWGTLVSLDLSLPSCLTNSTDLGSFHIVQTNASIWLFSESVSFNFPNHNSLFV